ncbi:hypothetical protein [Micromonospora sp. RP3T]|uniref:hypothetical protein n=1 Tax=Micromonospora sp. RP3T TaxID=2135446 RepID=UPI003D751437
MSERNVTVHLRMVARQYVAGATEGERATRRLAAAQRDLAGSSRSAGDELDRTAGRAESSGRRIEASGRRAGRGMLYAAAGVAALGGAGGAIKLLPGLLSATAVSAAALPPMLLGAAASGGVLVASLKGVGKAAGEVLKSDDPFAGLSVNARTLVAEVKALQPAMSGVRQGLQDRTLATAAEDLNYLATRVLPRVRGGLNELATDWGQTFSAISTGVGSTEFVQGFNTAAAGADWFLDMLNARIPRTVATVGTLVESADPLARAFGESLVGALDDFNGAVDRATRSDSLKEFFANGARGVGDFMAITGGVLELVGLVTSEVAKQNGSLADTRAQLDAYLASGRGAADVAGTVHTLTTAYEGLKDVVGPLGAITRDALADPATADALATMFDVMAAGSRVLQLVFATFQQLPDGIQSTVLVAIAAAVVWGKLSKAMTAMQAAADRSAVSLERNGKAGERAGRGLQRAAAGAGKAAAALVALQIAGAVLDQFDGSAADVDALGRSIEDLATKGKLGGELTRLFGADLDGMSKAAGAASDRWLPNLGRSIESLLPPVKNLNEIFLGGSWTGSADRFRALDEQLAEYARTTGDVAGAQEVWNRAFNQSGLDMAEFAKLLPSSTAELDKLRQANETGAQGFTANAERARVLAGSFQEAALRGKDLAATMDLINGKTITAVEGQIKLEQSYDDAAEVVKEYGRVTRKGTNEIDLNTKAGRDSMSALIGIQQAATAAADAEVKRTGNTAAGLPILNAARDRFIELATKMTGSAAAAVTLANEIFKIPNKDVRVDAETEAAMAKLKDAGLEIQRLPNGKYIVVGAKTEEGRRKMREAGFELKKLPSGKWVVVGAKTDQAKRALREAQALINSIQGKTVTVTVRRIMTGGGEVVRGPGGGGTLTRARGGVSVPYGRPVAAAMGLVRPDIYPASDPPLYQFAERETGGELFLPRRGIDRERGRALLAVAASWYGGMFVPMRRGGARVQAAAGGYVNVAPAPAAAPRASRLDYAEAYLRARSAVADLNKALKDNGRSFSTATAKGRENRSALYSAVRAAQDAARVKYEETGSVKQANAAYDAYIARLKATLQQQKVSAATIRDLMALAGGAPVFATAPPAAPRNSSANIAFVRADISARGGVQALADELSLNRPEINVTTDAGRANLGAVLSFLEQAQSAAQLRFEQTKSAKNATSYYNGLLAQFRDTLRKAGYSNDMVNRLLGQYGRITLQPNLRGGVYMAAAGGLGVLDQAAVYPGGGRPMYGWAEKGTGGELFLPRLGERARGERLLAIGAGWYGGRYTPSGATGGGPTTVNNNLTVHALRADLSIGELRGLIRQMDVEARTGRRR